MLTDLARQLLDAQAAAGGVSERAAIVQSRRDELADALVDDKALLGHLHALAIEGRLAEQLQARSGIDPVLSPLLDELAAAPDEVLAAAAMSVIAAQAGFVQQQRRMALPLGELPGELFHSALATFRHVWAEGAEAAEGRLRGGYDEGLGRLALLTRQVMRTGSNAPGALDVERAGLAVFATALALAAGQERDITILAFSERQHARLSLALRAAGLKQAAFEAQFLHFHPEAGPFDGFEDIRADRALAILAESGLRGDR